MKNNNKWKILFNKNIYKYEWNSYKFELWEIFYLILSINDKNINSLIEIKNY
jgi:hypothetical protein